MSKKARELSVLAVSKLKSEDRYAVGGLHIYVAGNSRSWIPRVAVGTRTNGTDKTVVRRRSPGSGIRHSASLAEVLDKARELRKPIKNGIDPLERGKSYQRRIAHTTAKCTLHKLDSLNSWRCRI